MMARSVGASPRPGFSTMSVTRTSPSASSRLGRSTTPYERDLLRAEPLERHHRGAGALVGGDHVGQQRRSPRPSGRRGAARRRARRRRGSGPCRRRGRGRGARPGGRSGCRPARPAPASRRAASSLPLRSSVASSSGARSKWSSMVFFDRPVTMRMSVMPAAHRLLDDVLDARLVDQREHLLRRRLGGGQEPGAEPGGGDDCLADTHRMDSSRCDPGARPEPIGQAGRPSRPAAGRPPDGPTG